MYVLIEFERLVHQETLLIASEAFPIGIRGFCKLLPPTSLQGIAVQREPSEGMALDSCPQPWREDEPESISSEEDRIALNFIVT